MNTFSKVGIAALVLSVSLFACKEPEPFLPPQEFTVSEIQNHAGIIATLRTENTSPALRFETETSNAVLSVDPFTGDVKVADMILFDYERSATIRQEFTIRDGEFESSATVTVHLEDENYMELDGKRIPIEQTYLFRYPSEDEQYAEYSLVSFSTEITEQYLDTDPTISFSVLFFSVEANNQFESGIYPFSYELAPNKFLLGVVFEDYDYATDEYEDVAFMGGAGNVRVDYNAPLDEMSIRGTNLLGVDGESNRVRADVDFSGRIYLEIPQSRTAAPSVRQLAQKIYEKYKEVQL